MEDFQGDLEDDILQDVSCLCSLSESELDVLVCLKILAIQHATKIGKEELAEKFDLKVLLLLGLVLMENVKSEVEDLACLKDLTRSTGFMDGCNLLKYDIEDLLSMEKLKARIGLDGKKKRKALIMCGIEDL